MAATDSFRLGEAIIPLKSEKKDKTAKDAEVSENLKTEEKPKINLPDSVIEFIDVSKIYPGNVIAVGEPVIAATPSFSGGLIPALAGRFISSDEGHESRQRTGLIWRRLRRGRATRRAPTRPASPR